MDTWSFTVANDGTLVNLSLDNFDDGTGKDRVAMDLYDSYGTLIDSSAGNTPLDQIADVLAQGTYNVAVYSIADGSDGDYRLVVQNYLLSPTPTSTPTATATLPPGGQDITSLVNNAIAGQTVTLTGNTANSADNHQGYYFSMATTTITTYGLGSPDVSFQFTLTAPQAFYFNLSATYYTPLLYILTNPTDPSTMIDLNSSCGSGSEYSLATGALQPGTYYVVVDSDYGNYPPYNQGPFSLSLSAFNPVCHLTPVSTPVPSVTPGVDNSTYTDAGYLGSVSVGSDLVAQGNVKENMGDVNIWAFTVQADGEYIVSLDCFDDGTLKSQEGFDLYQSLGAGSVSYMDASAFGVEPAQTTDWLTAGVTYIVAVYADTCGTDADYHLVLQGLVSGIPTVTSTPTNTFPPTPTPTYAAPNMDITGYINSGQAITGDTSLSADNYSATVVSGGATNIYGSGVPDTAFTFNLSTPQRLYFNLTANVNLYYPLLYILGPNGSTLSDVNLCSGFYQTSLTTGQLQPGTYTVVVDSFYNSTFLYVGPFSMTVSNFNPICALTPTSTPNPSVTPGVDDTLFTDAGNIGIVSPGSDLVGTGQVKYDLSPVNTWLFHVSAPGEYTLSADCYDDGTGKDQVALDLYQPNGSGGFQLVDATTEISYPNQMSDWLDPGDYYVAAYANTCGSDSDYHLVIQGTLAPTPTPEPAQDITSYINSGMTLIGDTTGQPDAHSYTDLEGNSWGKGAPDLVYMFTLNQPQQLDIRFGNGINTYFAAYLRTKQDDPSTTLSLGAGNCGDGCTYPDFITPLLNPGTYYLIVDGADSSQYGSFTLTLNHSSLPAVILEVSRQFEPLNLIFPAPRILLPLWRTNWGWFPAVRQRSALAVCSFTSGPSMFGTSPPGPTTSFTTYPWIASTMEITWTRWALISTLTLEAEGYRSSIPAVICPILTARRTFSRPGIIT